MFDISDDSVKNHKLDIINEEPITMVWTTKKTSHYAENRTEIGNLSRYFLF